MAIHSSTIAWKIPWTEEPGRLQSMGSQRVGHDCATSLTSLHRLYLCLLNRPEYDQHCVCVSVCVCVCVCVPGHSVVSTSL